MEERGAADVGSHGGGALEIAYREHAAGLKRLAFLLTGSNAAAEDAVHDVFLRCARRIGGLEHPLSYLRVAVVNECRAVHRRQQRLTAHIEVHASEELPEEVVETLDALAKLDERKRVALVLR